ncbi:MAG TPA: proton-conducting transporter membrane subunit [Candidatus Binatia bacterium]|nr:proton-conducting transporter membrane subunit [Candidatus Binatia bacterium]
MYNAAWVVVLLPLAGAIFSFVAETARRAAQLCMAFVAGSLIVALIVLGDRFAHHTLSGLPNVSALSYFSVTLPSTGTETSIFPSTFGAVVGVRVDNLSASFMVLIAFLFLLVQGLGMGMLRGDAAHRRFFWLSSVLASAMLGLVASPGLFQDWMALGAMTAITLLLLLHRWHREETAAPARTAFLTLLGADLSLLIGLVFLVYRLGGAISLSTVPGGFTAAPFDDYRILDPIWQNTLSGAPHTSYQTLTILCLLLGVPVLIRAAQIPFTGWFLGLREAPLPVLAAVSVSLLGGVLLLARVYTLFLSTLHALSVVAVIGAAGAVVLSAACLASRDIYRIALLSVAAQLALAITAMGAGGYSTGLLIAFVSSPLGLLLMVAAGGAGRAYRTRDIHLMGGVWRRMPRTGLALTIWALLTGGLDLVGYDAVSAIFHNRFPNAGHLAGWVQGLAGGLAMLAVLLTAMYAGRVLIAVCAGGPAPRRGGVVERITEAGPELRRVALLGAAASVVAVLIGLPGVSGFGSGRSRVPGLTFTHWVFYGGIKQDIPFVPLALVIALAALAAGLAGGGLVARLRWAGLRARLHLPQISATPALRRAGLVAARLAGAVSGELAALDHGLVEPLYDASGEGLETAAWSLGRLRGRRLGIGLAAMLAVVLILVGLSVLAASGHFPVRTT